MSLFRTKKIQEENNIMKETILPETMTMSYSRFVAQEHDRKVDQINAELMALESRITELKSLYQDAIKNSSTETANRVSEAMRSLVKQRKGRRLELLRAEQEYKIDPSAKSLAEKLDQFSERERLYDLYLQIRHSSIELVKMATSAALLASRCGTEATAAGNICWSFQRQILPNMDHDFAYHIIKPDREALLNALEAQLQVIKVKKDKRAALEEKIMGIEGV